MLQDTNCDMPFLQWGEKLKYIVNSREMKLYDTNTSEHFKVPPLLLMERAAVAFTDEIRACGVDLSQVLIVCGSGNNGGDGLAIARILKLAGYEADIVLAAGHKGKASEANQIQQEMITAYGWELLTQLPEGKQYTAVIDAVFGVGLSRSVEGNYRQLLEDMNRLSGAKIAVDIASGISADSGEILGVAFRADMTITFAYEKIGMRLFPGAEYSGEIRVKDIGIGELSWLERKPAVAAFTDEDLTFLAERTAHSHKGTYGKLLLVAGSVDMAGAACLAAKAAYASGCGLVRVVTPEENRVILQSVVPEAVLTTYSAKKPDMTQLTEALGWADVIVCGPGLGTTDAARQIVKCVLKNAAVPVLLDADALNLIAENTSVLLRPHTELVVTPHLGEMSRLTGDSAAYIGSRMIEVAEEFARQYNVICVLKDARTVTSVPYSQTWLNLSGNAGMATAGSGDVLSGIIGSLMAQGMEAAKAAPLGVYVHGRAGDKAAENVGMRALAASDIVEGLRKLNAEWGHVSYVQEREVLRLQL